MVARHSAEEVSIEGSSSSSGEEVEMEAPPTEEQSEGSSAEETGEEASPRRGKDSRRTREYSKTHYIT